MISSHVTNTTEKRLVTLLVSAVEIGNERAVKAVIVRLSEMGRDLKNHTELLIEAIKVLALLVFFGFSFLSLVFSFLSSAWTFRNSSELSAYSA